MIKESDTFKSNSSAYTALMFVVFIWGITALIYVHLYEFFSPGMCSALVGLFSALALLFISAKELKSLNKAYFLIAIPSGLFQVAANLLQKIGLQYTTPARYAFLENLSCIVVPVLMFFFVKKKPSFLKISAGFICLAGAFVLSGISLDSSAIAFGKGEILCALSGIFYGFSIAITGAFAGKLSAALYVMIQMWISAIVSFGSAIVFNNLTVNGAVIEPMRFTWGVYPIVFIIIFAIITNALCWTVRTNALKKIDASVVAVILPFSAVITAVVSVIIGTDKITLNLVLGGILCLAAAILSGIGDSLEGKKRSK
ncbi:MAG: DMT family transporter [Ruminococcaceae bacterium]|nr:DMT family transporter [Oscillospiraceae bacterium]